MVKGGFMKYRTIQNAGIDVSIIALGCWQFAGGKMWGDQDDQNSIAAVHSALDNGINLFDTAEGYGNGSSEEVLGKALKGKRNSAVVATKASGATFEENELTTACENSLRRLNTDYIDIYQLHWPRKDAVPPAELMATVEKLKKSGKIRYFGVCNYGPGDLSDLLPEGTIVTNQLSYSLLWRGIEYEIVPLCKEHNIGILTYSTLVHGLLSGKYGSLDEFPENRSRTLHFSSERESTRHGQPGQEELTNKALSTIRSMCADAGVSMIDAAFGWAANQPHITSVLAGARNVEQVENNARIADIDFPEGFFDRLTEATDELKEAFGAHADMWQVPGRIS